MFCRQCGAGISDSDRFCSVCGSNIQLNQPNTSPNNVVCCEKCKSPNIYRGSLYTSTNNRIEIWLKLPQDMFVTNAHSFTVMVCADCGCIFDPRVDTGSVNETIRKSTEKLSKKRNKMEGISFENK